MKNSTGFKLWTLFGLFAALMLSACNGKVSTDDNGVALFPIRDHGKWGFMDATGKTVIAPKYDSVGNFSEGLCAVVDTNLSGCASCIFYINQKGQSPFNESKGFPETYSYAGDFNNGHAIVSYSAIGSNDIYQIIDKSGGEISLDFGDTLNRHFGSICDIRPIENSDSVKEEQCWGSTSVTYQPCGYAFYSMNYETNEGKWCYATMDWKTVHFREFDEIGNSVFNSNQFSDGLLQVRVGDKWGYINEKGEMAIQAQFDEVQPFVLGHAWAKNADKWGLIDKKGTWQIEPKYENKGWSFTENTYFVEMEGGLDGIVNNKGEVLVDGRFYDVYGYECGPYTMVRVSPDEYAMIDNSGNVVIGPYEELGFMSEGMAYFGIPDKDGYKYGYLDEEGKVVIEPTLYETRDFKEGLAWVKITEDGKYGCIDKTGKFVIEPQFDNASDFSDGLAKVRIGEKYGLIDKTGKFLLEVKYDDIDCFKNGLSKIDLNGKYGFADKTGKIVLEPKYDKLDYFDKGLARFEVGGKMGYVNEKFEVVYMEK